MVRGTSIPSRSATFWASVSRRHLLDGGGERIARIAVTHLTRGGAASSAPETWLASPLIATGMTIDDD